MSFKSNLLTDFFVVIINSINTQAAAKVINKEGKVVTIQ